MYEKSKLPIYSLILSFIFIVTLFAGCGETKKAETKLTKVNLNEVVRSVFYAPMYASINQGIFKEEGIDIDLTTGQGADATLFKTFLLHSTFLLTFSSISSINSLSKLFLNLLINNTEIYETFFF